MRSSIPRCASAAATAPSTAASTPSSRNRRPFMENATKTVLFVRCGRPGNHPRRRSARLQLHEGGSSGEGVGDSRHGPARRRRHHGGARGRGREIHGIGRGMRRCRRRLRDHRGPPQSAPAQGGRLAHRQRCGHPAPAGAHRCRLDARERPGASARGRGSAHRRRCHRAGGRQRQMRQRGARGGLGRTASILPSRCGRRPWPSACRRRPSR